MRVLIVEDEPELADLLDRTIRDAAWAPDVVVSGQAALEALAVYPYDLVVLDVGLPDLNGDEVCRTWRAQGGRTPILMLTARTSLSDRVAGLDAGADDYLAKPFEVEELLARLRALARRSPETLPTVLQFEDLVLNPATRMIPSPALKLSGGWTTEFPAPKSGAVPIFSAASEMAKCPSRRLAMAPASPAYP